MARKKRIPRDRRTLSERAFWELVLGPYAPDHITFNPTAAAAVRSAFGSDEERREAWEWFGPSIMAEWMASRNHPGRRPWAWWRYVAGLDGVPHGEAAALRDMGALERWEEELLARWEAEAAPGGVAVDAEDGEVDAS